MPGSSAVTITKPAFTPVYERVISVSLDTLSPPCFIATIDLTPAREAPIAASKATFSFAIHWASTSSYLEMCSKISELGVPGYPAANKTPLSYAPSAIASFPYKNVFFIFSLNYIFDNVQPVFDAIIHIIIPEERCPSGKFEVFKSRQTLFYLLQTLRIVDSINRIGIFNFFYMDIPYIFNPSDQAYFD